MDAFVQAAFGVGCALAALVLFVDAVREAVG